MSALYLAGMEEANNIANGRPAKVIEATVTAETDNMEAAASEQMERDGTAEPPEW